MKNSSKGFTVTELMIAVGILAVILIVGIPTLNNWMPKYRLRDAARQIASDMQLARYRAISVNQNCGVDFDADGTHRIFKDDGATDDQYDGGDTVERTNTLPSGVSFSWDTYTATNPAIFRPTGSAQAGTIKVQNSEEERSIIVAPAGRVRIE
jgi:prepilin-type N-terminal cleavage/methylation domain-containing protein